LDIIAQFRDSEHLDIEKCNNMLHACKKLSKKIKNNLKKHVDYYLQMHNGQTVPASLALSALTNSVYMECDIWNGLNAISSYTFILQTKIQDAEYTNDKIRTLWKLFETLQKTDFNKKFDEKQK